MNLSKLVIWWFLEKGVHQNHPTWIIFSISHPCWGSPISCELLLPPDASSSQPSKRLTLAAKKISAWQLPESRYVRYVLLRHLLVYGLKAQPVDMSWSRITVGRFWTMAGQWPHQQRQSTATALLIQHDKHLPCCLILSDFKWQPPWQAVVTMRDFHPSLNRCLRYLDSGHGAGPKLVKHIQSRQQVSRFGCLLRGCFISTQRFW